MWIAQATDILIQGKLGFLRTIEDQTLRNQFAYAVRGDPENEQWGSQSRGLIVLFLCDHEAEAMNGAVAIELMHNAALLVDDLIDKAKMRRGNPSFWVRYGAETTTLIAHTMISRAFNELGRSADRYPGLAELILSDISVMAEAELRAGRQEIRTGQEYLAYAHAKTGRLFERAASIGMGSTKQCPAVVYDIGRIGLLHQLVDDVTDGDLDGLNESAFGQCNWTRLSKKDQVTVLNETSMIQKIDWPRLQIGLQKFRNAASIIEVLREVGQLPNPSGALRLAI